MEKQYGDRRETAPATGAFYVTVSFRCFPVVPQIVPTVSAQFPPFMDRAVGSDESTMLHTGTKPPGPFEESDIRLVVFTITHVFLAFIPC
ncbi:hypothetical protein L0665_00645 [Methanogenium marinum]|uniref:Uncharacterized protein n=1 Tax=Methanogenium marinum TaxID=348610 RepID=A0A9Q4PW99_9EURY|nr:hypothetical protein [Methanogenium marinum]MDE4907136.1 hypothetical protein [Methanogenium marinum]